MKRVALGIKRRYPYHYPGAIRVVQPFHEIYRAECTLFVLVWRVSVPPLFKNLKPLDSGIVVIYLIPFRSLRLGACMLAGISGGRAYCSKIHLCFMVVPVLLRDGAWISNGVHRFLVYISWSELRVLMSLQKKFLKHFTAFLL